MTGLRGSAGGTHGFGSVKAAFGAVFIQTGSD
jgi:hypothetical protein